MPRRPEIGNVQLYPNRPLKKSDKNGYVLKFYCPIRKKRIRRNCGTRDRREARRILRECRERLLNGQYVDSGGAISVEHNSHTPVGLPSTPEASGKTWADCWDRYRNHLANRVRPRSLDDARYAIQIAERVIEGTRQDRGTSEGVLVTDVMTLDMLEYLQDRLLAGDECRYDIRSPNTVNSMMAAIMAFVRFCHRHGWIIAIPPIEKLDTDDAMKGRPVSGEEFERMLASTPEVVGTLSAPSWQFALKVLWESGFRVGDLMDFTWDDDRHIHPVWPSRKGHHPTIVIPSTQKNGLNQEIPMLPGLRELLEAVLKKDQTGWVVNPLSIQYEIKATSDWFKPSDDDLSTLAQHYSNRSIATACGVSDTAVRKWLRQSGIRRTSEFQRNTGTISRKKITEIRRRSTRLATHVARRGTTRLTKEQVGRTISDIGKDAAVVVQQEGSPTGRRLKYGSAHDLRRGCAQRLINAGVSAETLKVVMRHRSFSTTERFYGATRAAQAAATELIEKVSSTDTSSFVGGLVGGQADDTSLSSEELSKLKALLNSL